MKKFIYYFENLKRFFLKLHIITHIKFFSLQAKFICLSTFFIKLFNYYRFLPPPVFPSIHSSHSSDLLSGFPQSFPPFSIPSPSASILDPFLPSPRSPFFYFQVSTSRVPSHPSPMIFFEGSHITGRYHVIFCTSFFLSLSLSLSLFPSLPSPYPTLLKSKSKKKATPKNSH